MKEKALKWPLQMFRETSLKIYRQLKSAMSVEEITTRTTNHLHDREVVAVTKTTSF